MFGFTGHVPLLPLLQHHYGTGEDIVRKPSAAHSAGDILSSNNPVLVIDGAIWQLQRRTLGISRVWADLVQHLLPELLRSVFVLNAFLLAWLLPIIL